MKARCYSDPKWKYRKACETNIKLTFERERKRLAAEARQQTVKVTPMRRAK